MPDTSDAQRISALTRHLLDHKLAANADDAAAQAERLLQGQATRSSENTAQHTSLMLQGNLSALTRSVQEMAGTLVTFRSLLERMNMRLDALTVTIDRLQKPAQPRPADHQATLPQAQTFTQDDISVEKVFYSGQK